MKSYNKVGYWWSTCMRSRWLDIDQVPIFASLIMDQARVQVHKQENRKRAKSSHLDWILTEHGQLIKDLLYGIKNTKLWKCHPRYVRCCYLACLGSQSQCGIWFIFQGGWWKDQPSDVQAKSYAHHGTRGLGAGGKNSSLGFLSWNGIVIQNFNY